jgi:glutamyl-tRNA synthetase
MFPSDAEPLVQLVCTDDLPMEEPAVATLLEAGRDFFVAAAAAWTVRAPDFKAWARAVGEATGRKGAALYMPLRAALTGATHGPELAPLVALMGPERVAKRVAAATIHAAGPC